MIHRRKGRKLSRTAPHRKAMLSNMSASLIKNKKVTTTLAKAKELRTVIEPLITKSKKALNGKDSNPGLNVHYRRLAFSFLKDREAVTTLFDEIAPKIQDRPGGYTRVLKMGRRLGDAAEVAIIELVDFNLGQLPKHEDAKASDKSDKKEASGKKEEKKTLKRSSTKTTTKKKKEAAA